MPRRHRAALCWTALAFQVAWPAHADGGISSLGGMLPILLALWAAGLGLFFWFCYSVYLLYRIRVDPGHVDPKLYPKLSVILVCLLLSLGVVLGMLNPILLLGAVLCSAIVGAAASFIVSRARDAK